MERRPQQGAGRKNALFLTPVGRDSAIGVFPHQLRDALLEGIAPDDPDRAGRVLDQIARTIDRLDRP